MKDTTIEVTKRSRRWQQMTPRDFIRNTWISHGARMLWIILDSFSAKDHEGVWPSTASLRHWMGRTNQKTGKPIPIGKEKLQTLMRELEKNGFVERHVRKKVDANGRSVFSSNLYILMDEPFYGSDTGKIPQPGFPATETQSTENPWAENGTRSSTKVAGRYHHDLEGSGRPSRRAAPVEASRPRFARTVLRTKKGGCEESARSADSRVPRGGPGGPAPAVAGDHSDTPHFVRPSAPEQPVAGAPGREQPPGFARERKTVLERFPFPKELIGRKSLRDPEPEDDDPVKAGFFLHMWIRCYKEFFGRYPQITERDVKAVDDWIADTQPAVVFNYLALAVCAWTRKIVQTDRGFKQNLVSVMNSRTPARFLKCLDSISGELNWHDYEDDDAVDLLRKYVPGCLELKPSTI